MAVAFAVGNVDRLDTLGELNQNDSNYTTHMIHADVWRPEQGVRRQELSRQGTDNNTCREMYTSEQGRLRAPSIG